MRKMIALLALALLIGGGLFLVMSYTQGFIMIAIGNRVIQFSLWMGVVLLLVLWCCFRLIIYLLRNFAQPGLKLWRSHRQTRLEKNRLRVLQGLESFYEGRWQVAKQDLVKSASYSDAPALNYLVAAEAAAELGRVLEAEEILAAAEKAVGQDNVALLLARARVLMRGGEFARASTVLRGVLARHSHHSYALHLLKETLLEQQDWDSLEKLLPDLRRTKVESSESLEKLETRTRLGVLNNFLSVDVELGSTAQNLENLSQFWSSTSKKLRQNPDLLALYCEALSKFGEHKRAESLLRQQINREWNGALVLAWAKTEAAQLSRKITIAEGWLKSHKDSPELLLTLGRICRQSELWGKAKDYLERAVNVQGTPEAYGELALVMSQLGERSKSDEYYQLGLKSSLVSA